MDIYNQNESIFNGEGIITYDFFEAKVTFQIEYSPFKLLLKTSGIKSGQLMAINHGKFEGVIEGNIKVKCSKICLSAYSKYKMTFVFLNDLIFGENQKFNVFKAKIFGLNINIGEFEIDNYVIKYILHDDIEKINEFKIKFGSNLETGILEIKKNNLSFLNVGDTIELSKDINLLLSFIIGKDIVYNRYSLVNNEGFNEIIRIRNVLNSSGKRFIFREDFNEFLPILYDAFSKFNAKEKKCIYTIVGYLNSTSSQYLEDSILNIAQIWEILSDTFVSEKIENSDNVKLLKQQLKRTIKEWHKSNEVVDYELDFISERVLNSMNWEKVRLKLETLVNNEGLNSETIGLNFKDLISIRNQIAHSGRFKEVGIEDFYFDVYNKSLFGIKVFILSKLGYKGDLVQIVGGLGISNNISYYLK